MTLPYAPLDFPSGQRDRDLLPHDLCEVPLTLIASVTDGSSVLIAADSKVISTDNHSWGAASWSKDKLRLLGDDLVWGCAGDMAIAELFSDVVTASAPFSDWRDLGRRCGPEMRKLNDADPRIKSQQRNGTAALFAGTVGNELGILEINQWGGSRRHRDHAAIGWGFLAETVAWTVASRVASALPLTERFRAVVEATVTKVEGLEGPISAWQLTLGSGGLSRPWAYGVPECSS